MQDRKSNYEKFAEEQQVKVLRTTVSLKDAIETIKRYKRNMSEQYIEWAEEVCADIFGRHFEEIRDAVDGKEAWISIAGMYDTRDIVKEKFYAVHMKNHKTGEKIMKKVSACDNHEATFQCLDLIGYNCEYAWIATELFRYEEDDIVSLGGDFWKLREV